MQCHRAELDLMLLKVIGAFPNGIEFRGLSVNLVLSESDVRKSVLSLIASMTAFACSPQVIARMIAVGAPGPDHVFPRFSTDIFSLLSSQIACMTQEPEVLL
jgi:hypothetical protein